MSDEVLLVHIKAIHAEVNGEYSWPRMAWELVARGLRVGKDRVQNVMQRYGIKARCRRKYVATKDSRHGLPTAESAAKKLHARGAESGVDERHDLHRDG